MYICLQVVTFLMCNACVLKIQLKNFTIHQESETKVQVFLLTTYLVDTALSLDFRDSENDWNSDGPALSRFGDGESLVEILWMDTIKTKMLAANKP